VRLLRNRISGKAQADQFQKSAQFRLTGFLDGFSQADQFQKSAQFRLTGFLDGFSRRVFSVQADGFSGFLRLVYDAVPQVSVKALHLKRDGESTRISAWDIEEETCDDYFQNFDTLQEYIGTGAGEPIHVVRCIRPLLEKYLRMKFPHAFGKTEWLGDFIAKIHAAGLGDLLAAALPVLADLEAVNDYSKPYHHDGDTPPAPEPIVGTELQSYARRTVSIIGEAWICPATEAVACWASSGTP